MSITPVDKPPDGDEGSNGPLSQQSSLREHVSRFVSWLVDRTASIGLLTDSPEHSQSSSQPVSSDAKDERQQAIEFNNGPSFREFPNREKPLTYPARDSPGINTPDVVSIETEEGLRLSVPENPDAAMTSDVWTTVEP